MSTVDLKILEQFMLELCHENAKPAINSCFEGLRDHPVPNTLSFLHQMGSAIKDGQTTESWACVNGLLVGISLAATSRNPHMLHIITDFLELQRKKKGENVVDFFQAKAGKNGTANAGPRNPGNGRGA